MIPILYTNEETLFLSNGIGRLSDCVSCEVTEERNGIFECEFVYPITGKHYEEIKEGCLIYCTHDDSGDAQPFEIYKRSATIDGLVTFSAHHISYRLSNIIVKPFSQEDTSVGLALAGLEENAIGGCPFTLQTTKSTSGVNFSVDVPDSIRARLGGVEGSILDVFGGGEYKFDKFTVTLYDARGVDNGVSIRYGKNLTDITAEQSIEGRYTGVVPFWKDDAGIIVTLPEWYILADEIPINSAYWTNEDDTIIRDESGNPFEFDYFDIALAPMDLSDEWEEPPTVAQLRAKAESQLAASKAWETDENIEIDFVALWQTPEYEDVSALQRVQLCDTVTIYYPALKVELKKKVIKTVYNVLLDRFDSIELGMPQTSLADSIVERVTGVMSDYVRSGRMQAAINNATQLIRGGLGGYVVMKANANGQPEEILIMDTDDINTAVNVIRMNQSGIGFSRNGYQGPYETAWTIDGHFVADFIDTGILNADLIKAGTLSSYDGQTFFNLALSIIRTVSGNDITELSGGRIKFIRVIDGAEYITASITPVVRGNVGRGVQFAAESGAKYVVFSHNEGGAYSEDLIINNGLNPNGDTEKILAYGSFYTSGGMRVKQNAYFMQTMRIYAGIELLTTSLAETTASNYGLIAIKTSEQTSAGVVEIIPARNKFVYIGRSNASLTNQTYADGVSAGALFYVDGRLVSNEICPLYNYNVQGGGNLGAADRLWNTVFTDQVYFRSNVRLYYEASSDNLYCSSTITQASDERLKNLYPYDDKYDTLLDVLEPILFTWKDRPNGSKYVGLGARKTAEQIEELGIEKSGFVGIGTDDKGEEVYGIDYSELSVMLLHKVQKQQKEIDTLKTQLADVLERLERLEAKNANT